MIVSGKAMIGSKRPVGGCFVVVKKNNKTVPYTIIDTKLEFKPISGKNTPDRIIIHHALAKNCTIEDIHKWHLDKGYSGAGYHYFVNKRGEIYKGRPDNVAGAHTKEQGINSKSIGICLEGCYEDYEAQTDKLVPLAQMNALKWLVGNLNIKTIEPHNKYATYKKCPGNYFPWDKFIKEVSK
jgi:N-acetyl-anhydromuramyl-L-alanine amidase AmpD